MANPSPGLRPPSPPSDGERAGRGAFGRLNRLSLAHGIIGETRTQTGLTVTCRLPPKDYPTGLKITNSQMARLNLCQHAILLDWNYILRPREKRH
jgi:hypothetical protein